MKLLIPVDGSAHAEAALDFVASRATLLGEAPSIRVINVQPALSPRVTRAVGREVARAFLRGQADEVLRPALDRLTRAGIRARASYAIGHRPDVIGTLAARGRVDLIVMGSRGHSGLKGLVFGSTTQSVLAGCTTPLLVVRDGRVPRRDSLTVGIAVDGSRYGLAAVRWAIAHRALFGAEPSVELIHVGEGGPAGTQGRPVPPEGGSPARARRDGGGPAAATDADALAAPRARLAKAGIDAKCVLLAGGSPGDAIAAHARRRRLDLLVMGSHGHGVFKAFVLGSVAMRVAASCATPLLLVRESGRARD